MPQKVPAKRPLLVSSPCLVKYVPCATQRIAAPNPIITDAAITRLGMSGLVNGSNPEAVTQCTEHQGPLITYTCFSWRQQKRRTNRHIQDTQRRETQASRQQSSDIVLNSVVRSNKKRIPKLNVQLSSFPDVLLAVCLQARESHLQTAPPPQTIRDKVRLVISGGVLSISLAPSWR